MNVRRRRRLRRLRFALMAALAAVLIALAAAMGIVQLLVPLAASHPDFIARQLSARLQRPVRFTAIASRWQPSGVLLSLRNLTLESARPGGQAITFPHAALELDFGAWLQPAHRWITLRIDNADLRVRHGAQGWEVPGFGEAAGGAHESLQSLPVDLDLRNLRVEIDDVARGRTWTLVAPRLKVVSGGDIARFGGSVRQPGTTQVVAVSGRVDVASRDYSLHAATANLDLAEAVRGLGLDGYAVSKGRATAELWASWRGGRLHSASARYSLHDVAAVAPDGRSAELPLFAGLLRAERVTNGWNFAWRGPGPLNANIDAAGGVIAQLRGGAGARRVTLAAHAVELSPWLPVLALLPQSPPALANWVGTAQPRAWVDSAALVWQQGGGFDATVRCSDVRASPAGAIPGITLAQAVLRADPRAISLRLPQQPASLNLAQVFRAPFEFTRLGGTLVAWRDDGAWTLAADAMQFALAGVAGSGHASLTWPGAGQPPFLAAYAVIDHAQVVDAKLFWPFSMPATTVAWLDRALVDGELVSGRALVRGDLGDWPFRNRRGRFEANGKIANATLDFAEHWPRATQLDAQVDFINNGMDIVASHANVRGVAANRAEAVIPDLDHGVLGLDVQGSASGAQLLDFVRNSPVGSGASEALDGLVLGGSSNFDVQLSIPLADAETYTLSGRADLLNADLRADKWKLVLGKLNGALLIDGPGFRADDLTATFRGAPARLSLAVGSGVKDATDLVEASLTARVSAQTLGQGYPELTGLLAHFSGVAPFQIGVRVLQGRDTMPVLPMLRLRSSLAGIALDFPAPLHKPAESVLPLDFSMQLPPEGAPFSVALGELLQVRGRLADPAHRQALALAVNFGRTPPAMVPASGLVVGGHAGQLDVGGWVQQAIGAPRDGGFPALTHAAVSTDAAWVFGNNLGALNFNFQAGAEFDTVEVDGPAVKGKLELPTSDLMTRGVSAQLQRLHWPEASMPQREETADTPPAAATPLAPASIPPLHIQVADLHLGRAQLGATRLESVPVAQGMHIAQLESSGTDFRIRAQGDWTGTAQASETRMTTTIDSRQLGNLLDALGLGGVLAGGQNTHLRIDGRWPGAPLAFSLPWVDGSMDIEMERGRILAIKPGFGRMLGLLSLRELPSRLAFHFGDVFRSGFGFDKASAHFVLKDGSAYSDAIDIRAPSARIKMRGRTGLRARDFDLAVDVIPQVGGTLPLVGALLGGPVGAAAGLMVQGIAGKDIDRAAGDHYRVTGTWDDPKILAVDGAAPGPPAARSGALPAAATSVVVPMRHAVAPSPPVSG